MTTIPPSTPIPIAAITGGPDITALLTQLPPDLQAAGRGTTISGTVIGLDNQGQVLLQTGAGIVGFQSLASVSVGQQVTLQVQSSVGGRVQALVMAAEAKAMDEIASAETSGSAPDSAPTETVTPAATVAPSVRSGSVVIATVIAAAPGGASAASSPSSAASAAAPAAPQGSPSPPTTGATGAAPSPAGGTTAAPATAPSAPAPAPPPTTPAPPGRAAAAALPATPTSTPAQSTPSTAPPAPAIANASAGGPTLPAPSPAASPSAASPATLPAADVAIPPRAVSMAIASYAVSATAGTTPTAGATPATNGTAPLPAPPPGTLVPLRFVSPLPTLAAAAAGASSGQMVATVVGRTPSGQMIVDTAIGRLAFTASAADTAPAGSQIAFEIAAPAMRPPAGASGMAPLAGGRDLAGLTTAWPALKDAVATLTATDPALARHLVETALPQLGNPRFVAQVLTFLATSVDDVKALLGQAAVDALLQSGHSDVLTRLQADLTDMSRLNSSRTDWQVFYLPLLDPTQTRQLRVYTRRRKAGTDWRHESGRFVVDVEFENVGPLQLDGLVQKPRLDLILRSHTELAGALKSGITDVFTQTCAAARLTGKLFFQAMPAFPVSPFDEMSRSSQPGVSV